MLLHEDATLFERGGSGGAGQTGEEYRQTLRRAIEQNHHRVPRMPWGIGSGMITGAKQGIFFCASVGERTYLRFVPTDSKWHPFDDETAIVREIGTCLRLIECEEATPRHVPNMLNEAVFDVWAVVQRDIWNAWMRETDPANLQPKVRPLNQRVAEFIRANRPPDDDGNLVNKALDILEAPWPRREEILLRDSTTKPRQVWIRPECWSIASWIPAWSPSTSPNCCPRLSRGILNSCVGWD
jgi:hypothetical protein